MEVIVPYEDLKCVQVLIGEDKVMQFNTETEIVKYKVVSDVDPRDVFSQTKKIYRKWRQYFSFLNVNEYYVIYVFQGAMNKVICSTAMLCAAIMTEHWEHVAWEHAALAALANASNTALQWLLDEKVAKIEDTSHRKGGGGTFLVPMNGGIWTMCVSLEEEEVSILSRAGFPSEPVCTNYLANSDEEEPRADWQHRMQNLSISCALVCLIVLGSAALVGAFGICKHQISAVLITGVMYLLAGLFAMFTLMIIHFKRVQRVSARGSSHADGTGDGVVGPRGPALSLLSAREFSTSWSLELGWGGVALATTTSLLWILLSKIMRYNPISAMLLLI